MKPTTKDILQNARLHRWRLCRGKRHTKGAAIMAIRLKAQAHELRRAIYLGLAKLPVDDEEPF